MLQNRRTLRLCFFAALFLLPVLVFAGGKKEDAGEPVNGLKNWDHTIDISGTKPGKYNIIVQGRDRAGNVEIAGPYNVYVDPESDIPIANINNPSSNMRVSGNLNILGTAVDDDKVERVELSLDGGEIKIAEGTEYWSYYLPVNEIPDGRHTLTAIAYDINGTKGKPATVTFNLDKFKPDNTVNSHENGVVVGGQLQFKGFAQDANEIATIEISEDNGKIFAKTGFQAREQGLVGDFGYALDTKKFPDGPKVIWIRTTDKTGSVNASAFLIFVDNTPPQIEVFHPGAKDKVHGTYRVIGAVREVIGLQKLEYEFNGKTSEIVRVPGNPFFSLSLTIPDMKERRTGLVIRAVDTAGNRQEVRKEYDCDIVPDYPVVQLFEPKAGATYTGTVPIKAFLRDDDAIAAFWYQLDASKPVRSEAGESLDQVLENLPSGVHELSVWAEDKFQLQGLPTKIKFTYAALPARISFDKVIQGKTEVPFANNMQVEKPLKPRLSGSIASGNPIKKAEITLAGLKPKELALKKGNAEGQYLFEFDPGLELPYGVVDVLVTVQDNFGQVARLTSQFYVRNDSRIQAAPELLVAQPAYATGVLNFPASGPIDAQFVGATLQSVKLEPELPFVGFEIQGNLVRIVPKGPGSGEARIVCTDAKGHEFPGKPVKFIVNPATPVIDLQGPQDFAVLKDVPELTIKARDDLGLESAGWTLGNTSGTLTVDGTSAEGPMALSAEQWAALPDGLLVLEVTARDVAGLHSTTRRVYEKDTQGPQIEFASPATVFGSQFPVLVYLPGELPQSLRYRLNQDDWQDARPGRSLVLRLSRENLGADQTLELEALDAAGNVVTMSYSLDKSLGETPAWQAVGADGKKLPAPKPGLSIVGPVSSNGLKGQEELLVQIDNAQAFGAGAARLEGKPLEFNFQAGDSYGILKLPRREDGKTELVLDFSFTLGADPKQKQDVSLKIKSDRIWDKPVLATLVAPTAPTPLDQVFVAGLARDDSDNLNLKVQIDGGNPVVVPMTGKLFVADFGTTKPGKHKVKFQLTDGSPQGMATQEINLDLSGPAPQVAFESILNDKGQVVADFRSGLSVLQGARSRIRGNLQAANQVKEVLYAIDGTETKKIETKTDKTGTFFEIPVPESLEYGKHLITAVVKDQAGLVSQADGFFQYLAPEYAGPIRDDEDVLYYSDDRLLDGRLDLQGSPFMVRFVGRPLAKAWLEPEHKGIEVSCAGQLVSLKAIGSADLTAHELVVEDVDGDEYRTKEFAIKTDFAGPEISTRQKLDSRWVIKSLNLDFSIKDGHTLASCTYAVVPAGSDEAAVEFKTFEQMSVDSWTAGLDLTDLPDGQLLLVVKATDQSGNVTRREFPLSKDTVAPVLTQVVPLETESLNGIVTVSGVAGDDNALAALSWSADGKEFQDLPLENYFAFDLDVQKYPDKSWIIKLVDAAGNESLITPSLAIDTEKDLPQVVFQTPPALEVQRKDFQVSGMVFDDDGVADMYYRIDWRKHQAQAAGPTAADGSPAPGSEETPAADGSLAPDTGETAEIIPGKGFEVDDPASFTKLEGKNSFSIPVEILKTGDNEHEIEMYAVDINGVPGRLSRSTFRISTAEPINQVQEPDPRKTLREIIRFAGTASDNNTIKSIQLSFDNGNSWHLAQGAESWEYYFDTRTLKDGTYNVIVKTLDGYETPGMYATLINVDNTPPALSLDEPLDGRSFKGNLLLSGRADDTIGLQSLGLVMVPADAAVGPKTINLQKDLPVQAVILDDLDVSSLSPGWYTLRIEARDKAENLSYISRDILIAEEKAAAVIDVYYPRNGEAANPYFHVSGQVRADILPKQVTIELDGVAAGVAEVNADGFFRYPLGPDQLKAGEHRLGIATLPDAAIAIKAQDRSFTYQAAGPWLTLDAFAYGDFVSQRPYLSGKAGYLLPEVAQDDPAYPEYDKKNKMGLGNIEVSYDNGRTFAGVGNTPDWKTRLETQNYPNGPLYVMFRLVCPDGATAVYHTMLMVDEKKPEVKILFPGEEGRFNEKIPVVGTANDNYQLDSINILLREGDKANYEVPSFIQGMYVDFHALGATNWEAGLGLTFFDDNVKLQVLVGQAPADTRFDGYVGGVKLIANVAKLPFSYLFGPDWDFFSMSLGVGADFSYFTMSGAELNFDTTGVILGGAVIQWEFAKFYIKEWSFLRTYSFYAEGQIWFISSDVEPVVEFKPTFGIRMGLF